MSSALHSMPTSYILYTHARTHETRSEQKKTYKKQQKHKNYYFVVEVGRVNLTNKYGYDDGDECVSVRAWVCVKVWECGSFTVLKSLDKLLEASLIARQLIYHRAQFIFIIVIMCM